MDISRGRRNTIPAIYCHRRLQYARCTCIKNNWWNGHVFNVHIICIDWPINWIWRCIFSITAHRNTFDSDVILHHAKSHQYTIWKIDLSFFQWITFRFYQIESHDRKDCRTDAMMDGNSEHLRKLYWFAIEILEWYDKHRRRLCIRASCVCRANVHIWYQHNCDTRASSLYQHQFVHHIPAHMQSGNNERMHETNNINRSRMVGPQFDIKSNANH